MRRISMDELTTQKWYEVCDKVRDQGYSHLTPAKQVWIDIRDLIDSTNNGGLISYFYNSGADRLSQCLLALNLLGADVVDSQLERVSALFPGRVPQTVNGRNEVINSWDDDDESIDRLLEDVDGVMFSQTGQLEERLAHFLADNGLLADR
jgi:hypothetical protein